MLRSMGLKKGPWTPDEDHKLLSYIEEHGFGNWRTLPEKAGLERCGKSCRLRWINYLRPDVKRGQFSLQEEQTIIQLHAFLGNRWSAIAAHLPKRTDNEIKNYWNTHIKKRFTKMGIDPTTHKPKSKTGTLISHMAQWERARLEAEARLVRELTQNNNKPARVVTKMSRTTPSNSASAPSTRPRCLDVLKAWQSVVADMFSISTYNNKPHPSSSTLFLDDSIIPNIVSESHESSTNELLVVAAVRQDDLNLDNQVPELNERIFDNSMSSSHDTTYPIPWSAAATGGIQNIIVEDFPNFTVHDSDYLIEQGSIIN